MNTPLPKQFYLGLHIGSLLVLGLVLTGCSTTKPSEAETDFQPNNVYVSAAVLPKQVKRVAMLPVTADETYTALHEGREELEPVLTRELIKAKRFEIVRLTPEALRRCTGRADWTAEETLPAEMLGALHDTYGCDAVLFSQLTVFHASPPLAVGWRMKLVDISTGQILWASDEVFHAAGYVAKTPAPAWCSPLTLLAEPEPDQLDIEWKMDNSPRLFAEYALAQLLATLPAR
jgi:hypothetical protein